MFHYLLIALTLCLLLFNISATKAVIKDTELTRVQSVTQLCLIWLIPILGTFFVLYMLTDSHTSEEVKEMTIGPFYLKPFNKAKPNNNDHNGVCGSCGSSGHCGSD